MVSYTTLVPNNSLMVYGTVQVLNSLDIGASRIVVGLRAARALLKATGGRMENMQTPRLFRFRDYVVPSMGTCSVSFETFIGVLETVVDIVEAHVPLLIGVDVLDRNRLQLLTITIELQHLPATPHGFGWTLPIVRRNGYVWLNFFPLPEHRVM